MLLSSLMPSMRGPISIPFWFLILANLCLCSEELSPSNGNSLVEVIQGETVTLPCKVAQKDGTNRHWELNGSSLENTTRRYQIGSNLHITRVDRERDSGQFVCVSVDSEGVSSSSPPVTLNIKWIEEPTVQLQEPLSNNIKEDSDIILRCHLDASGDIIYEWFRNNHRLVESSRTEIKKKRLHLKHVKPIDNGVYSCSAKNEAGTKLTSTNFILAVPGENSPLIRMPPRNQVAKKGSSAYFDCVYQGADVIEWYFKDIGPLKSNEKYVIHTNQTLEIKNVEKSDEGYYNCVGMKSESTDIPSSYTAKLQLAYISPSITFEPDTLGEKIILPEGFDTFQWTCLEPIGFPRVKRWWLNPHGHTVSDTGEVRVDDDGRLIIPKLKLQHGGKYTCVAENIAGKTERTIEIIVTTQPKITTHTSTTIMENDEIKLVCEFDSEPQTSLRILWRKDGKVLNQETDQLILTQRIAIFEKNGTLMIHNAQPQDGGKYVCDLGGTFTPVISKPSNIFIIETLKFIPAPVDRKLELGSMGRVHCKAQGTPTPTVVWQLKGKAQKDFPSHVTDTNGTLYFNGVKMEDKGNYICIASSSQGVINATIKIDVVVSPKFSVIPKNPTEAIEGQSVIIDCVVEGDPKPTIHWDKNLVMNDFDKSRFAVLPNGSLFISEVRRDDENKYGCTAGSSAGLNRKETQLIIISSDDTTVTKAVLITISVAAAYIFLVVGLMVWCRYRRKSRKSPEGKKEDGELHNKELQEIVYHEETKKNGKIAENHKEDQKSDGADTTHSQGSANSKKYKSGYDRIALPKNHLKDLKLIGRGDFGDIMVGKVSESSISNQNKRNSGSSNITEDKEMQVLVKVFKHTKDEYCSAEFKREIDMFLKLSHENVTKLIGLCRESEPHYLVLEHTDWGDLKQFLLATKKGNSPPLSPVQATGVLHQIAKAMDHISSNRMVLKDLAARNCLVTSSLSVKVGLPRLTRDPYSQEYCKHANQIIPLRWMPYEAVYEDEFSTKSDIYSFGVVIGEVFSQGELPYPKLNDNSVLKKLEEKKLEYVTHPSTPEELKIIQISCQNMDPKERPIFSDIVEKIAEVLSKM